jgi:hypothetical protein
MMFGRVAMKRASETMATNPDAAPMETLVGILMPALAVEAFINELGEHAGWAVDRGLYPGDARVKDLAEILSQLESDRATTALKYQMAAKILSGQTLPEGEQPFQAFAELMKLRDVLVHLKPRGSYGENEEPFSSDRFIRVFRDRSLTRTSNPLPLPSMSWMLELESAGMAEWANEAAHGIILAIGEMLPSIPPMFSFFKLDTNPLHPLHS